MEVSSSSSSSSLEPFLPNDEDDYDYADSDPSHSSHRRYENGVDHAEMEAYPLCDKLFCTETVWDTVASGNPRRGYWGPWPSNGMALENSCESDYLFSKYISEFWCTLSCLVIFTSGLIGLWLTHRFYRKSLLSSSSLASTTKSSNVIISSVNSSSSSSSSMRMTPASVLFVNLMAVGIFGVGAHMTQWRFWEILELMALQHFTVFVALIASILGWGFRSYSNIKFCLKVSFSQLVVVAPTLYFNNIAMEIIVALSVILAQISFLKLWLVQKNIWNQYPRILMLIAQVCLCLCILIDVAEMYLGCDWEVEMDYNGNVLNDPNLHNHLHAASLVAMGCAMYLAIGFLNFTHFAKKDAAIHLRWFLGLPYVETRMTMTTTTKPRQHQGSRTETTNCSQLEEAEDIELERCPQKQHTGKEL